MSVKASGGSWDYRPAGRLPLLLSPVCWPKFCSGASILPCHDAGQAEFSLGWALGQFTAFLLHATSSG